MKRSTRIFLVLTSLLLLFALALPVAAKKAFPDIIAMPDGFRPEGITLGNGHTFYGGSLGTGAIVAGDLRSGEVAVLNPGAAGWVSVGMSFDSRSGYLFVAGGPGAVGRVIDTATGALVAEYPMASGGGADFINDVIVTRDAAYFTNSFAAELTRVPLGAGGSLPDAADVMTLPLTGDWQQMGGFNANGIEATANGNSLIVVSSAAQAIYEVDPATGVATQIDLGAALPFGDGLALAGHTLYVVQNQLNQIAIVSLSPDLASGTIEGTITNANLDVPTTALVFGNSIYAVNAKFSTPPTPTTPYEVVKMSRR